MGDDKCRIKAFSFFLTRTFYPETGGAFISAGTTVQIITVKNSLNYCCEILYYILGTPNIIAQMQIISSLKVFGFVLFFWQFMHFRLT